MNYGCYLVKVVVFVGEFLDNVQLDCSHLFPTSQRSPSNLPGLLGLCYTDKWEFTSAVILSVSEESFGIQAVLQVQLIDRVEAF